MKKLFILLLVIFCQSNLSAQLQIGSSWHYQSWNWSAAEPQLEPQELKLTDTLTLDGKLGFEVEGHCGCWVAPEYIAQENGVVYWHQGSLGWLKLYNYNLIVGQRDTCFLPQSLTADTKPFIAYRIDSISWDTSLTGEPIKVQHISYDIEESGCNWATFVIYENYGSDACFFPVGGFHDGRWTPFLCYEINGVTEFSPSGQTCDVILSIKELTTGESDFSIHPNPIINDIQIEAVGQLRSNQEPLEFVLVGLDGRVLRRYTCESNKTSWQFSLETISQGLYHYHLVNAYGQVLKIGRLVKM